MDYRKQPSKDSEKWIFFKIWKTPLLKHEKREAFFSKFTTCSPEKVLKLGFRRENSLETSLIFESSYYLEQNGANCFE